jgi:hypothetical protein
VIQNPPPSKSRASGQPTEGSQFEKYYVEHNVVWRSETNTCEKTLLNDYFKSLGIGIRRGNMRL